LIVADGFSCQEQIAQLTNRRALHLAQIMSMALKKQDAFSDHACPEATIIRQREAAVRGSMRRAGVGTGMLIALGIGGLIWASQANGR
jgi:hypothetical protein